MWAGAGFHQWFTSSFPCSGGASTQSHLPDVTIPLHAEVIWVQANVDHYWKLHNNFFFTSCIDQSNQPAVITNRQCNQCTSQMNAVSKMQQRPKQTISQRKHASVTVSDGSFSERLRAFQSQIWTHSAFRKSSPNSNTHTHKPTHRGTQNKWWWMWHCVGHSVAFTTSKTCLDYLRNHSRHKFSAALLLFAQPPLKGSRLIPLMTDGGICGDNVFRCQRIGIKHTPI